MDRPVAAPSEPPTAAQEVCSHPRGFVDYSGETRRYCPLCGDAEGQVLATPPADAPEQQDDERNRVADLVSELLRGQVVGGERVRSDEARRMGNRVAGPLVNLHHRALASRRPVVAEPTVDTETLVWVQLPADDVAFVRGFDPDRDRTASRADMVRVVEHLQAALGGGQR